METRKITQGQADAKNTSSRVNSEAVKNSLGLDIVMPKDTSSVNYDKLKRVASLMARTQRI